MYSKDYFTSGTSLAGVQLKDSDFRKLSTFINTGYGIKLPDSKKVMIQSRLLKRLRALNLDSFTAYFDLVFNHKGPNGEMVNMIDAITTNKTDFFREPIHFEFLNRVVLPEYMKKKSAYQHMNIWSAGCSSGEEPYTIAMSLLHFSEKTGPLNFRILGTDLSTEVLSRANSAIYSSKRTIDIPSSMRKTYMEAVPGGAPDDLRFKPAIREKVNFKQVNFMDNYYSVNGPFDIIFCRNVLIYFEREVQERVINKLCKHIPTGGYFFLGHSESIMGMDVPLEQIRPTIFRKK